MAAARQVLERSTMMLLTSSKTCLRHPECPSAKENRDTVFCQMRRAMDLIHYVVKDGVLDCSESQSYSNSQVSCLFQGYFINAHKMMLINDEKHLPLNIVLKLI